MIEKPYVKTIIAIFSIILTGIVILFFALDKSLAWNAHKIISCMLVCIWVSLLIPAFRYDFLKLKEMSFEEGFRAGVRIGLHGIVLPLLIVPYFGIKYYLEIPVKKDIDKNRE